MLLQDLRYGLRTLWKSRGISLLAILCLALGVGLNATMFSVVDGVLLQGLPYHDPERIAVVYSTNVKAGFDNGGVSYEELKDLREASKSFEAIGGVQYRSLTIADSGHEPERHPGAAVSWQLFPLLGIQPIEGRAFNAADDVPGAEPVVMLSHSVWTLRYNSDRSVINTSVLINARPHTVIGVMPPRFEFPELQKLWVPLGADAPPGRNMRSLTVFARLRPGVSIDQANGDVTPIAARLEAAYPATNKEQGFRVATLREEFIPEDVSLVIWLMMGDPAAVRMTSPVLNASKYG